MFCDVLIDSPESAKFVMPRKTVSQEPQEPEGPRRMPRAPTEYLKRPLSTNFVYHTDVIDIETLLGPLREEAQDSTGATEYDSDDWLGPMPLRGGAGSPGSLPSGAFSSLDDFGEDRDETGPDGGGSSGEHIRRADRQVEETFEDKCARLGVPADIIKEFMEEEREREAKREALPVPESDDEYHARHAGVDDSLSEEGGDLQEGVEDVDSPASSPVRFPDEEETEPDNAVQPNPATLPSTLYPDEMMDAYIAEWERTRPASPPWELGYSPTLSQAWSHESAAASQASSPVKVPLPQPGTQPHTPQRKREPFSWELAESVTTAAQQSPRTPNSAIPRRRARFTSAATSPRQGTPQRSPPRKKARFTTEVDQDDQDPITSLLALIESGDPRPPPSGDDITVSNPQARHYYHYHGHTTTTPDGPFHSPLHLICQLLTALTWLAMLILTQPSNLFSTLGIITSYFLLPLGWLLHLTLYYIRLLPHNLSRLGAWILNQPLPPHPLPRPARPVLGTPSAAAIVSSVISLVVVFTVIALQAVMYEREVWVRANSWTAAYVRDIIERQPYPWWSPVQVDFRLAVMDWVGWWVNAWAFPERWVRTW
ncbi:hypothetical protein GE09DRAFT_762891 [Coniochaeta sp. 2T2.1]|nr:hypothetical protein GE09DRAFT_762891 [Coniochaeta sp. 2T2.1]